MEDKLNNDSDSFKKIIRNKIKDEPMSAPHDEVLWSKVFAEIEKDTLPTTKTRPLYYWYASAALFVLGLGICFLFYKNNTTTPTQVVEKSEIVPQHTQTLATKETSSPISQIQQKNPETVNNAEKTVSNGNEQVLQATEKVTNHTLADGSSVSINAHSSISTTYTYGQTREVTVNGEVYFEVAKDKNKPFIVHFGGYRLEVLGTKFNVRSLEQESIKEITVTEGVVKVFENNQTSTLVKAGEQLKLQKQKEPVLSQVEAINFISWKTNVLDFKNSRLEDVAHILTRLYHQPVSVEASIKDCIFSGDLTQLRLDEALEIIKLSSNLTIEKRKHQIHLAGNGCD